MSSPFPEFPKREWANSDADFKRLKQWWAEHEQKVLLEKPELGQDRKAFIGEMAGDLGLDPEIDSALAPAMVKSKEDAAVDIADKLGYRSTHNVPIGREAEWLNESLRAGRAKRSQKLNEMFPEESDADPPLKASPPESDG